MSSTTRRYYTTPNGLNLSHDRVLGAGQFGTAHAVKNRRGEVFCLKEVLVRTSDDAEKQLALQEVELMAACNHPNIVKEHVHWFERNRLYILMEFCPTGSLDKIIEKNAASNTHLVEITFRHYMLELASALDHCHNQVGIMHRDLKPANVFIDKLGRLKLGDFGMSKELGPSQLAATFVGTPLYMAPEVCTGATYSFSADMWALGCVMYELMTNHLPWVKPGTPLKNYIALVQLIQNMPIDFSEVKHKFKMNTFKSVNWLLCRNIHKRATAMDIVDLLDMRSPPDLTASMLEPYKPFTHTAPVIPEKVEEVDVSDHLPETVVRQQNLVSDAVKLVEEDQKMNAIHLIQQSYRSSVQKRANMMPPPPPKPLTPTDKPLNTKLPDIFKKPPPPPPVKTETDAANTIIKGLRTSMNRRRVTAKPRRVATPMTAAAPKPEISSRLHELATPRTVIRPAIEYPARQPPMPAPRRRIPSSKPLIVPAIAGWPTARKAWL